MFWGINFKSMNYATYKSLSVQQGGGRKGGLTCHTDNRAMCIRHVV